MATKTKSVVRKNASGKKYIVNKAEFSGSMLDALKDLVKIHKNKKKK